MLSNKNIILTGGGRGLGRIFAHKLANEGARLILLSRTEEELKRTLNEIKPKSPESFYISLDISDISAVKNARSIVLDKVDKIDCLINNAAIQPPIGLFHQIEISKWINNIKVNLNGTAQCIYFFVDNMIKNRKGKIINLSGGGSTSPRSNFSSYALSKTAIVRFTEILAKELNHFNIDVNALSPGAINTKMLDEVLEADKNAGEEITSAKRRLKDGGDDPKISAELLYYLCSDSSDGITGKLISAIWDPWQDDAFLTKLKSDKDFATLRRIDDKTFFKKI